jgi:hypothetical protein
MDIKAQIEALVKKVTSDPALMQQFKTEPIKAAETVLGVDLPDDVIQQIITGVKAKIAANGAQELLGGLKKFF